MGKDKVLGILGIEATVKGTVEFSNEKGHWAILIFEDERLSRKSGIFQGMTRRHDEPFGTLHPSLRRGGASVLSGTLYADSGHRFPQVAATSLAGRALSLPAEFGSPAALVFVAFAMKQQSEIDAWKHFVDAARAKRPSLPSGSCRSSARDIGSCAASSKGE